MICKPLMKHTVCDTAVRSLTLSTNLLDLLCFQITPDGHWYAILYCKLLISQKKMKKDCVNIV